MIYKVILILIISCSVLFASIKDKTSDAIKDYFKEEVKIVFKKIELDDVTKKNIEIKCKQRFFKNWLYSWKIFKGDSLIATAFLDNVFGKAQPISFLVIYNSENKIIHSEIIKYREQYGGAVKSRNWNEQFVGKDYNSSYKLGKEIQGISGATISVKAVSKGIKKLSLLIEAIKNE